MTAELLTALLKIIEAARGDQDETDRDCHFLARGRNEACDEIEEAIKKL